MSKQLKAAVSAAIAAENTFTSALGVEAQTSVAVSISGAATATVFLQRQLDGTNWRDVQSWTADIEATYVSDAACQLRLGVKAGGYGSGTATCRLQVG